MKNKFVLLLVIPFIFSCARLYVVKKEDAIVTVNNLKEKYQQLDNVELNTIIDRSKNKNKDQYAYDNKNKLFYEYHKSEEQTLKKWLYFENDALITLREVDIDKTVTKIKYKDTTVTDKGEIYFKKIFKQMIDLNINQLTEVLSKEKDKEEYLTHGSDLIININYSNMTTSFTLENNCFTSCCYKTIDNNKVVDLDEYTFSYGNFTTSVNPSEFLEV